MNQYFINKIEHLHLLKKHRSSYINYYKNIKRKLFKELHQHGISNIKAQQKHEWKIWYNTCYFSGTIQNNNKKTPVFIKVMGKITEDTFQNEIVINKHIENLSSYLLNKLPRVICNFSLDSINVIVYEYIKFSPVSINKELKYEITNVIKEYSRIGILHTDFGLGNMGLNNNKHFFFDYGTSLCSSSDKIRIRNSNEYNHINRIIPEAKKIIDNPDFYYDDVIHCGVSGIEIKSPNFIVGKNDTFFAKLGEEIIKYHATKRAPDSNVLILNKIS